MLDPRLREKHEAQLRPILQRYIERSERCHDKNGRSTLPELLRQIQYNVPPPPADVTRKSTIGELEAWVLTVAWALAYVGPMASRVVLWRLTRREKSSAASWPQIALELNALGYEEIVVADVKQMFEIALPLLAEVFEQLEITPNVRTQNRSAQRAGVAAAADHCAAAAKGLGCGLKSATAAA